MSAPAGKTGSRSAQKACDPEAFAQLASRCERLESMIAAMDQGLAFVDARGLVMEINDRCLEFLGLGRETVLGKPFAALGLDTEEYQASALVELFAKGASRVPVTFNRKFREADAAVTLQPVRDGRSYCGVIISVVDVTPLVEARLAVEREKTFLEQIITIAGAAICIVNRDGVVTNVNEEFTAIAGYGRDEALGRIRTELLREIQENGCPAEDLDPEVRLSKRQTEILTKQGRKVVILKNAAPLFDAYGRVVGGIESFVDVGELIAAGKKAEEANRLKSVFLANMSHEIRTPLNALLGLPQILYKTGVSEEQRECLDAMRSAGQSLLVIVNDILDFSKIEAGRLTISRARVNLRRLLADIRLFMAPSAEEKGLSLTFEIDPSLPAEVETDPVRLRQILVNLLSNAIKFTAKGKVDLSVETAGDHPAPGSVCLVRFCVADTGRGVPKSQVKRIFEPFTQADDAVSRHHGGTGLGLSISQSLTRMLGGGDIQVRGQEGQGSEFSLTLPLTVLSLTETEARPAPREEPQAPHQDFSEQRVLVAEDNAFNRFLLKKVLERLGVGHIVFADNGQSAVDEVLRRQRTGQDFDVIFMDLRMPGLDGLSAAREIRKAGATTPIVALTAQAMSEAGRQCREAGMDHYLSKPYDLRDLEAVFRRLAEAGPKGDRS